MNSSGGRVGEKVGDCHFGMDEEKHLQKLTPKKGSFSCLSRFAYVFWHINTIMY